MHKTLAAILALSATAHAGGFALPEQTAVSAGTGGAGVARDGDPGAAWHDPAALADGGGLRLDISMIFARPALEAQALDGSWTATNEPAWATPPHLDASYAQGKWAVGISLGVPFGSGVTWSENWPGRYEIVATKLQVFRAAPFFAYSLGKLRVAAGVHLDAGRMQINRNLDFIDMEGDVAIDMDGRGVGGHASLFYAASPRVSLGAIYRSRTRLPLEGGANFTAPEAFANKVPDQTTRSELVLPDQMAIGTRVRVTPSYAAVADVEYTLWSVNDETVIDFAHAETPDVMQANGWSNTLAVRAGGEYARGRLTLRHGMYYDQSPAPSDRLVPTTPDSDRVGLSAGASWQMSPALAVDVFAESLWILRRETQNMDALQASYGGRATLAGLGLRYTP